jgi:hypothetical protein
VLQYVPQSTNYDSGFVTNTLTVKGTFLLATATGVQELCLCGHHVLHAVNQVKSIFFKSIVKVLSGWQKIQNSEFYKSRLEH